MPSTENTSKLFLVLVSLLLVLPAVEALDAGDTIAFLLGLAVSVVGFCACLGRPSTSSIILVSMFNQEEAAINLPVKMTRVLKLVLTR
uniref:Uncharacterized protein n=1 Tax=Ficedula albicollis TaxID=59894 RepID=A0A803VPS9_FICAL